MFETIQGLKVHFEQSELHKSNVERSKARSKHNEIEMDDDSD